MTEITISDLWNQFHHRLLQFVSNRVSDPQDAEDIVQDVFMRIHDHLDTVRNVDRLESWIYQIARNSIADAYRRRQNLVILDDLPGDKDVPNVDSRENLAPYLREIVETLPEPYREALLLTEYEGLTQKELANRLGISLSGAKSRVQRARQKVKEVMLSCCHFQFDVRGVICCYRSKCSGCDLVDVTIEPIL